MIEKNKKKLQELTGKKHVKFVKRGNFAIKQIFKVMKEKGLSKVYFQDQGGWITYPQFAEKHKFEVRFLKTDFGIINDFSNLKGEGFLLINSMPGYHALQDMKEIYEHCKNAGIPLVNDAAGSISYGNAAFGDIIIGSFGKAKPLSIQNGGGFIAYDDDYADVFNDLEESEDIDHGMLNNQLKTLNERQQKYKQKHDEIISDLLEENPNHKIVHPESVGINVIILYSNDSEKYELMDYCDESELEYTECPRYIRVRANAISIEVKRLDF